MKKIDVLIWGVQHIAKNHGFDSSTDEWEEDGEVCVYGNNVTVPLLADMRFLCESLGINYQFLHETMWGIDIAIPYEWSGIEEEYVSDGFEMWKKADVVIGS